MKKFIVKMVKLIIRIYLHIYAKTVIVYHKESFAKCGKKVHVGRRCEFIHENIYVGNDVFIGDRASFRASIAKIYIGNHVMIGPGVTIRGGDHRMDVIGRYMKSITDDEKLPENDGDVIIEDDVWIGANAIILKGVTIGKGSVIGAGSVVTRDIPPYTIHVGNHPILEKKRFTEEQIIEHEKLLKEAENKQ